MAQHKYTEYVEEEEKLASPGQKERIRTDDEFRRSNPGAVRSGFPKMIPRPENPVVPR